MKETVIAREETKATSQHQITIPKRIWEALRLEVGVRFSMLLTEDENIIAVPQRPGSPEISDREWKALSRLAHSGRNISRRFNSAKAASAYLKKL